jgi:Animal haem peroxidase
MKRSCSSMLKFGALIGLGAVALYKLPKILRCASQRTRFSDAFDDAAEAVDHAIGWDKLPPALGVFALMGIRNKLRKENLYDTTPPGDRGPAPQPAPGYLAARTPDGTCNDLVDPAMGSASTRFGRNVPLEDTWPGSEQDLMTPNPRTVSLELLTRHTFQPATTLNLLAAAWLQFMIRDWFSHGKSQKHDPWQVPLQEDDPWPEHPMQILRTRRDHTRTPAEDGAPPTHINTETHWWDASQIYGSTKDFQAQIRTGPDGQPIGDGKILIGRDRMVHVDPQSLVQQAQLAGWWLGLEMLFTLFTLEHNAICDHLKAAYPEWSDEDLFQHARLINAALLAKIHTVEWTTAILGHPTLQIGMRTNWWGIATERVHDLLGRISDSEVISGIPGSQTDHFGVPYAITEEFVAVYRMHPLIPDDLTFRSAADNRALGTRMFQEIAGLGVAGICEQIAMGDCFYSFGTMHPGAVVLHNYPTSLQHFTRPDGRLVDLAATDVLRVRELGVPRYTKFRELLHLRPVRSFEELTDNPAWREEIRRVYNNDIDSVDLMVGCYAERPPKGFGFSDTAFRIFVLMASRRLNSDRFFTTDYTPEVYTREGMDWIDRNTLSTVLLRHYPMLAPALRHVKNAFAPWSSV